MDTTKTILAIWAIGLVGCLIMKKIQPENFKLYAVYVLVICILLTIIRCTVLSAV